MDGVALPTRRWAVAGPFPARDRSLSQALAFALGFLLPILTLKTGYYGTPTDLASRVALVDFVCVIAMAALVLRGRPAPVPLPGIAYFFALVLSLFPSLVIFPGRESYAWTAFAALFMAFLFYVLGLSVGESPAVTSALLKGVCAVTLFEGVIVFHDYFFSSQWFPDPMAGRARGTFKANGQLGAFGFCAAGLLLAMGRAVPSRRLRFWTLVCGFLAASFVFTASRRTGMICVFVWAAVFAAMGVRFARRRGYRVFVALLLAAVAIFGVSWGVLSQSFAGKRLTEGVTSLRQTDGFIQNQHRAILRSADQWFPFGFGPGRGNLIDPSDPEHHEVHNGLLAVMVELGVLGLLGFVALVLRPLFRRHPVPRGDGALALRATIIASFLLVSVVFMFHNTLYRDRTFMLFLGMATAIARHPWAPPRPEPEVTA
jgi:O-antigen ligase